MEKELKHIMYPSKTFEIYNANSNLVYVNPFSAEHKPHTGSILHNDGGKMEEITMIRLQFKMDNFDFLNRPFFINGKKVNISLYFSEYQIQTGVLDIPYIFKADELQLEIPLCGREHCIVSIYSRKKENVEYVDGFGYPECYVVLNNTSCKSHVVNLIDLMQLKNIPDGVLITNNDFKLHQDGKSDFELLRIWSNDENQLESPLLFGMDNPDEIHTEPYMSPYQNHNHIVSIPYMFKDIHVDQKLMVNIASHTKCAYHLLGAMRLKSFEPGEPGFIHPVNLK